MCFRFCFVIALLIFFYASGKAQKTKPPSPGGDLPCCIHCDSSGLQPYVDFIFGNADIEKESTIYAKNFKDWVGNDISLVMDIYRNPACDSTPKPCIILAHGGGFKCGSRDKKMMILLQERLARRGFVVASIQYRQGWQYNSHIKKVFLDRPDDLAALCAKYPDNCGCKIRTPKGVGPCSGDVNSAYRATYRAIQDSRAAIRYLKASHRELGIDTSQVFFTGYSAGGVIALNLPYLDQEEVPSWLQEELGPLDIGDHLDKSTTLAGIISNWGALYRLNYMDNNKHIPVMLVHGTCDRIDPYFHQHYGGCRKYPVIFGSYAVFKYARQNELPVPLELYTACGYGHNVLGACGSGGLLTHLTDTLARLTADFMYRCMNGDIETEPLQKPFPCKPCYCNTCNSPRFSYDDPFCAELCGPEFTPNASPTDPPQNPYTRGNPLSIPHPCRDE